MADATPYFSCPNPECKEEMSVGTAGPNWTTVSAAPAADGWQVYVLSCRSCGTALGAYAAPSED